MVEARNPFSDRSGMETDLEEALARSRSISLDAREAEQKVKELREVSSILKALPMSWAGRDPGKYGPRYTFLSNGSGDFRLNVIVEELLPEEIEVFKGTKDEWKEHPLSNKSSYDSWKIVPPHIKTVESIDDVLHRDCPDCRNSRPVIEEYYQTYDSPYGDEWRKRDLVLCCDKVQVLNEQFSEYRF